MPNFDSKASQQLPSTQNGPQGTSQRNTQWWAPERDVQFRPCVGLMVINPEGLIFTGCRFDSVSRNGAAPWQMPQGGIEEGEAIEVAARRELEEETGLRDVEIIAIAQGWYHYGLPPELQERFWGGKWLGQAQAWVLMRFSGTDSEIRLDASPDPEFVDWRWTQPEELPQLAIHFKKTIYELVLEAFSDHLKSS